MTDATKYFVFIYPSDGLVREILDLIVYTISPRERWPAHITVAGPFPRRPRPRSASTFTQSVFALGIGNFFASGSNAVFLRVGMHDIHKYWDKPSFPGVRIPHVSLYNGADAEFAMKLFLELSPARPVFSFETRGVEIVDSSRQLKMSLRERVNTSCLDATKGMRLDDFIDIPNIDRISIVKHGFDIISSMNK